MTTDRDVVLAVAADLNREPSAGPEMDAGRALDAEICNRVFEQEVMYDPKTERIYQYPVKGPSRIYVNAPMYSRDIGAAWLVVEALREWGINLRMEMLDPLTEEFDRYTVEVGPWSLNVTGVPDGPRFTVDAPTAPLAICRAALAALGAGR